MSRLISSSLPTICRSRSCTCLSIRLFWLRFSKRGRFDDLFQQLLESPILTRLFELRLFFFLGLGVRVWHHPASWQVRVSHVKRFPVTDPSTCWKRSLSVIVRSL